TVLVDRCHVAGAKPAVTKELGRCLGVSVVPERDVHARVRTDDDLPRLAWGHRLVVGTGDDHVVSRDRTAHRLEAPVAEERAHEREADSLRHSPQVLQRYAE